MRMDIARGSRKIGSERCRKIVPMEVNEGTFTFKFQNFAHQFGDNFKVNICYYIPTMHFTPLLGVFYL